MKILKSIFLIFLLVFITAFIFSVFLPSELFVSRSIMVNAPKKVVWENVKSYKQFVLWSPWSKRDTAMHQTFTGVDGTVGSKYDWSGNGDVGRGGMIIKHLVNQELVESELRMADWDDVSLVSIHLSSVENQTQVTWKMSSHVPRPMNVIMYILGMKGSIEKDYDSGLQSLKEMCEKKCD